MTADCAEPAAGRDTAQSMLAAIVESSSDEIIGKTPDGVITSWNAGARRMYGYAAEEIIGQNISVLIPPDRVDELPAILAMLRQGFILEGTADHPELHSDAAEIQSAVKRAAALVQQTPGTQCPAAAR